MMSFLTVQSANIMTYTVLLSLFFFPSTLAACSDQTHLFITAPAQMEALSGSCLQIPCNFSGSGSDKFDSTRPVFGVWIKNHSDVHTHPHNAIFNSSGTVTTYPMNITGNLSQKNCTTLFSSLITSYTDTYYFKIMNWPFRATAVCHPLQITIKDSPWRPRIEIPDDLKENQSVKITCSAFTPCPHSPPQLTWNLQQDFHNQIEKTTDGTLTTKIQQTITLSDTHDGNKISCSARYPVNEGKDTKTAETQVTLSVSLSQSLSAFMSSGSWVSLTCSSRAKPPVISFTWFKKTRNGPVNVSEGDIYSFNVAHGGVYYCVATNDLGTQKSTEIHVTDEGEQLGNYIQQWAIPGGIIGVLSLILLCLIFFVCQSIKLSNRLRFKHMKNCLLKSQQVKQQRKKTSIMERSASLCSNVNRPLTQCRTADSCRIQCTHR